MAHGRTPFQTALQASAIGFLVSKGTVRFQLVHAAEVVRGYRQFRERWIGERVREPDAAAIAARLFDALLLMPACLAAALLAGGLHHAVAPAIVMAGAVLVALPMILCAAIYLFAAPTAVGLVALTLYGGGLVTAVADAGAASPVIWLLAAALPVEAWLVRRDRRGILVGLAVTAVAVLAMAIVGHGGSAAAGIPLPASLLALGYAALVATRLRAALAPAAKTARTVPSGIENAIDGVIAHLSTDGVVRSMSAKAGEQFGVSRHILVGTPLLDRVHVADRVCYLSTLADLRSGKEGAVADLRLRCAGGRAARDKVEYRTFRVEFGACPDEAGALEGFVAVARDIGDDLAARRELERALEEAESVQISKSRFLASVSHELRTPLNSIIGFSDILLHEMFGKFSDERQREYVELIQCSGAHLLSVVNAILDVSKIEAGSYSIVPESFAFKDATAMACAMMAQQARQKGLTLIDRAAPGNEVVADRRAIQQILINLISNAIKFTDEGGVVTVDSVHDASNLVFTVGDTGIGMSQDDLKKLGRPFFQIHNDYTRAYEGTGLGISLVKGLVELHGGKLEIASRPGEGTVVTVTIPQDAGGSARTDGEEAARVVELKPNRGNEGTRHAEVRKTG